MKRTISGIMLTLLLTSMLTLALNVKPVVCWTGGTIYIRADGSIDPPDAPITTYDNITYILTDNITSSADGIVVERDNIIIDGAGYTVQGNKLFPFAGISLKRRQNVTVRNTLIINFYYGVCVDGVYTDKIFPADCCIIRNFMTNNVLGVYLRFVSNNIIINNSIIKNARGIHLSDSTYNTISSNNITKFEYGIDLWGSSNNTIINNNVIGEYGLGFYRGSSHNRIFHNNLVNSHNVHGSEFLNIWDNGYPSGGNYWSDYEGVDNYSGPSQDQPGSDGIGDTPYIIDDYNKDRYPLMKPQAPFPFIVTGPIYVRADGSIDPPDAPISTVDNVTYVLTNNIMSSADGIVVERGNIIVDGAGCLLKGLKWGHGLKLVNVRGVIVKNVNIEGFWCGIGFYSSSNCTVFRNNIVDNGNGIHLWGTSNYNYIIGNNITGNGNGIGLYNSPQCNVITGNIIDNNSNGVYLGEHSDNNLIIGNNIMHNYYGINLYDSSCDNKIIGNNIAGWGWNAITIEGSSVNNLIIGNNFTNHEYTIRLYSSNNIIYHNNFLHYSTSHFAIGPGYKNIWDNGYPSGGNFWSDYTGVDEFSGPYQNETGSDGIGDTQYAINENNADKYPLMEPKTIDTYNLTILTTVGGTTVPSPGTYPYTAGFTIRVRAISSSGYVFDYWELDGINAGSNNPVEVLMDSNHILRAVFTLIQYYKLTISMTIGGTTNPASGTYTYANGTVVSVTAIPNMGYSFAYWLIDGNIRTENPITIVINANHTLEAYFVDDVPPEISDPVQDPPEYVEPYQNVTVTMNVTDYGTGVSKVTLWYSTDNGTTWNPKNMTEITAGTYQATIPGQEYCTWVSYKIIAYDKAGNNATKDNLGYHYKYHVIPEYPSTAILIFLFALSLTITTLLKDKKKKKCKYRLFNSHFSSSNLFAKKGVLFC
ncbi:MAG: NosD domain-containing protein [Candidatus Bathyarchaeia archaeon]